MIKSHSMGYLNPVNIYVNYVYLMSHNKATPRKVQ